MLIRKVNISDFENIYLFISDLENYQFNKSELRKMFLQNINNPEYLYLTAESDSKIIGFISFHTQNLLHHCGKVGEIQEFFILKDFRRKGISKLFMKEIEIFSVENNIVSIEVTSNKKREENVQIYENLGFTLTHNKFTKNLNRYL